jgi:hypothetical protein
MTTDPFRIDYAEQIVMKFVFLCIFLLLEAVNPVNGKQRNNRQQSFLKS